MERIQIGDYAVDIRTASHSKSDKTVLLIHGIGTSGDYYVPLLKELSRSHSVIALDLPGYGRTPKPTSPLTIRELADVVRQFILDRNLTNLTLVGHSMGCQVVTYLINEASVRNSILLSPTTNDRERTVLAQSMRLFQDTFLESLKANGVIFLNYARMGPIRFLKTAKYMVDDHIEDQLALVKKPVYIIRGEKDYIVPRDWVQRLNNLSQNIITGEVLKSPHAFHFRNPKETADACNAFIESY